VRCKYQYFRAQCACVESQLEEWMEAHSRGTCFMDILPITFRLEFHLVLDLCLAQA